VICCQYKLQWDHRLLCSGKGMVVMCSTANTISARWTISLLTDRRCCCSCCCGCPSTTCCAWLCTAARCCSGAGHPLRCIGSWPVRLLLSLTAACAVTVVLQHTGQSCAKVHGDLRLPAQHTHISPADDGIRCDMKRLGARMGQPGAAPQIWWKDRPAATKSAGQHACWLYAATCVGTVGR
jgi:hypothetical protein